MASDSERSLGLECDVEDCEERIVGLNDGWEMSRGTVCSDCIEYHNLHAHWPDREPEHCRQCILDNGGIVHDCANTSIDVLLRPGDSCPECEFELAVTDGGRDQSMGGTEQSVLYLVVAGCPRCDHVNRLVEETSEPVDLMQDVPLSAHTCDHCAHHVGSEGDEWDIREEAEIERVTPVQERGEAVTDCKWCDGQMYRDGSKVVCGSCGRSKLA